MQSNLKRLTVKLRIAVVQLNPQIGHIGETIARVDSLVSRIGNYKPDIVVFPEFALSGYNFRSRSHIQQHLSSSQQGPAWDLCQQISKCLSCVTVMGYPEDPADGTNHIYNSVIVVNSEGQLAFNYRKSFLYDTDEQWGCSENPLGFQTFDLPFANRAIDADGLVHDVTIKSAVGICMDLSPYKFEAPFQSFEFSSFHAENLTELILFPMAWLNSASVTKKSENQEAGKAAIEKSLKSLGFPPSGSQGDFQWDVELGDGTCFKDVPKGAESGTPVDSALTQNFSHPAVPDNANVDYWILRFMPFLAFKERFRWFSSQLLGPILNKLKDVRTSYMGGTTRRPWIFENRSVVAVMCNRSGVEDGTTVYAGSSSIFKFNGRYGADEIDLDSSNRSVEILGSLGKGYEGVLLRDVEFEVLKNVID
ncbi:LADA_0H18470g1_1 [Lachancea dasiensis]|uniref:LADA_0H18470g1_1 n=1 Tax=Lachancea dasiensis TaxID=1072105 RepID=A0A1G4K5X7_9SACH|nr:LADA_0H18470g1_1 [Lachancea dasiensis]